MISFKYFYYKLESIHFQTKRLLLRLLWPFTLNIVQFHFFRPFTLNMTSLLTPFLFAYAFNTLPSVIQKTETNNLIRITGSSLKTKKHIKISTTSISNDTSGRTTKSKVQNCLRTKSANKPPFFCSKIISKI